MHRKSPVSLWATLGIGVVLVGGVYIFARRVAAPPQTSAAVKHPTLSPQPTASILTSPGLAVPEPSPASATPSVTSQTIVPASDRYSGIVEVETADQFKIPGKYQCGAFSITEPEAVPQYAQYPYDNGIGYESDIYLEPLHKLLLQPSQPPGSGPEYDATFSKDCRRLYYFDLNGTKNRIHVLDISSGVQSALTIPISSFPHALVLSSKYSPNYPSLKFIYAIDGDHLLMWFLNPVSGPALGINDTSQAVYTVSEKKLAFVSEGGMGAASADKAGIALLNYKTNTLIVMGGANAQELVTTRTEIDLGTGHKSVNVLRQPGNPVESEHVAWHSCDYDGLDTHGGEVGYLACRSEWLTQLLGS